MSYVVRNNDTLEYLIICRVLSHIGTYEIAEWTTELDKASVLHAPISFRLRQSESKLFNCTSLEVKEIRKVVLID